MIHKTKNLSIVFFILILFSNLFGQGLPKQGNQKLIWVQVNFKDAPQQFDIVNIANDVMQFYSTMSNKKLTFTSTYVDVFLGNLGMYPSMEDANYEVLQQVDNKINFANYSSFNDPNIVDGIIIVYPAYNPDWQEAHNHSSGLAQIKLSNGYVYLDGKKISGESCTYGSGAVFRTLGNQRWATSKIAMHEIGHLIFGSGHSSAPYLDLMNDDVWHDGGFFSGLRIEAGWIKLTYYLDAYAYFPNSTLVLTKYYTLSDYMTTGQALEIRVGKYYFIENRKRISLYDQGPQDAGTFGDLGYFVMTPASPLKDVNSNVRAELIPADGNENNFNYPSGDALKYIGPHSPIISDTSEIKISVGHKLWDIYEVPIHFEVINNYDMLQVKIGPSRYLRTEGLGGDGDSKGEKKYGEKKEKEEVAISDNFYLQQNYPNPFNPTTKINFSIAKKGNVNLTVYNALGQKISTLVNEEKSPGSYTVSFDASKLRSGIYFYKLECGQFSKVQKMLLLK